MTSTRPSPRVLPCLLVVGACACVLDRDLGLPDADGNDGSASTCEPTDFEALPDPWTPRSESSGIAACTPVAELSLADATAWCGWYMDAFRDDGDPAPEGWIVDGLLLGGATSGCGGEPVFSLCAQHLSVEHCVANLLLEDCPLVLGHLERCARAMLSRCTDVDDACAAYLEADGCSTTIVQQTSEANLCPTPVE